MDRDIITNAQNKIISMLLVLVIIIGELCLIPSNILAATTDLEKQNKNTNNRNVTFDSYFVNNNQNTHEIEVTDENTSKVNFGINVEKGYLTKGKILVEEPNFVMQSTNNELIEKLVQKIIDLRRYLVLTEGKMEPDAQRAIQNIERQFNPWGINRKQKEDWRSLREDVSVPTVKEAKKADEEIEYLFWVGSMGSYDNRSQKIA